MKAIQLLFNSQLPPDLRDYTRVLDAKSIGALMTDIARKYPEQYERISKSISDIGRKASYYQGETLTLNDNRPVIDKDKIFGEMDKELSDAKANSASDSDYEQSRNSIWDRYNNRIQKETSTNALAQKNNLAYSVMSGARGKPPQLKMMLSTPGLYTDAQDNLVPMFIRNSFAEGLRPAEYLASTYGARKSVLATKRATAKGGDLAKQMVQSAARLIVTESDCGVSNGIDLDTDDKSVRGRVLAKSVDGIPAGTVIDRHILAQFRKHNIGKVIARSAMTCQAKEGLCSKCVGLNPEGKFPSKGDSIGITAAQSIGEPICLHEDTLVRMADYTTRKIKEIKPGDMVLGSDINGYLTPTKVVNVFHNGIRDGYKTLVRKGKGRKSEIIELISTKEHKVLSYQGRDIEKATPEIKPIETKYYRHWVYLSKGVIQENGLDEPLADILGVLIGDGCYNGGVGSKGLALSCYDKELEGYMRSRLESMGMLLRTMQNGEFRVSMQDQNSNRDFIDGALVRNTIKAKLIKEAMWGQGSGTKQLPASINTWNNTSVAKLIGGLVATDGWVIKGVIGFGSNSLNLLKGVKALLELRFGIYSSNITGKNKKRPDGSLYATNYTLTVSDGPNLIQFQKHIPIPGCKQERLNKLVSAVNIKHSALGRYTVISQEPIGDIDTWDIEVDNDTHLFSLANSLIVSNTQGALNTKHTGGAVGANKRYEGFDVINQFVQTPDTFPDKSILASKDGTVNAVIPAPQGGHYITIDNSPHYVAPGYDLNVKVGDRVEAGDALSAGLADPGEIVELRGLGEGRKYYANQLKELLDNSGMEADRRNTEILARAALDHVQINDAPDIGEYLPDDMASYNAFANTYVPPVNTAKTLSEKAVGQYLQSPALHYTIGTRVTPKISKHLMDSGFKEVFTSADTPSFTPVMPRLRTATHNGTDWLASMHTSYLKKQLNESATRGEDSNIESNVHFAPRLAIGNNFADNIKSTGKF